MTELFSQYEDVGNDAELDTFQSNYYSNYPLNSTSNVLNNFNNYNGHDSVNTHRSTTSNNSSSSSLLNQSNNKSILNFSPRNQLEDSRKQESSQSSPTSARFNYQKQNSSDSFIRSNEQTQEAYTPKIVYLKPDWIQNEDNDEFEKEDDFESQSDEEDDYISQYLPYVNSSYRTIGDMHFDEAMKKLSNIFQKTSKVEEETKGSPIDKKKSNDYHYGNRIHQQLVQDHKQHDYYKQEITKIDVNEIAKNANKIGYNSPDVNATAQRSFFSMKKKSFNEVDDGVLDEYELDLTEKIDGAIEALQSQGIQLENIKYSDYPKPKSIPLSEQQWENLINRLLQPSEKKKKAIEKVLKEKIEKEQAVCTYQPTICENSRTLASGHKSIFDSSRINDEKKDRDTKIQLEKQKLEEKRNEENIFKPKINKQSQNIIRGVETFEAWEKNKREKIKTFAENSIKKEVEDCTFNPSLTEKSRKLFQKKKIKKNVWERNYDFEFEKLKKVNQLIEEQEKQFSPNPEITDKAKKLQRSDKIGDRLHTLAMETLSRKKQKREELFGVYYGSDDNSRDSLSSSSPVTSRSYVREIVQSGRDHNSVNKENSGNSYFKNESLSRTPRNETISERSFSKKSIENVQSESDSDIESDSDSEQGFNQLLNSNSEYIDDYQAQVLQTKQITSAPEIQSFQSLGLDIPFKKNEIASPRASKFFNSLNGTPLSPTFETYSVSSSLVEDETDPLNELKMNQVRDTLAKYHAYRKQNTPK